MRIRMTAGYLSYGSTGSKTKPAAHEFKFEWTDWCTVMRDRIDFLVMECLN